MARPPARTAAEFVPEHADLRALRAAARTCQGCDLYKAATQTVFGTGDPNVARVVLVGEQPGDQEDRRGLPFVGPAGRVLDRALDDAGIDPGECYVTNAVKHFKFARAERGKRRIHRAPSQSEIVACRPWLVAELALVQPELLVCLGASAAKAVLGPDFRVSRERGLLLTDRNFAVEVPAAATAPPGTHPEPPPVLATIHPAAVLRALDRDEVYAGLVADLRVGARALH